MEPVDIAADVYQADDVSMTKLIGQVTERVNRPLTGEEIAEIVNKYSPRLQDNYVRIHGPACCSHEQF